MADFHLVSPFRPTGDQPQAIQALVEGVERGYRHQTLRGATGTGKTFVMASIVEKLNRPTLVIAHNKTLAAQLYSEFKEFFPANAVEYFVSYYDYYQPEAYIPKNDLYIEKDADINEEIDRLRLAATAALLSRRDVLIVASVSCIYGLGDPERFGEVAIRLRAGQVFGRERFLRRLVDIYYERTNTDLTRGKFRARGDTVEVSLAYEEAVYRVEFFGDEIERIAQVHPVTGEVVHRLRKLTIFPAKHFVTPEEKLAEAIGDIQEELAERLTYFRQKGKLLEAQRLEQRTRYDLEMLQEIGYCSGVENYSRHLDRRPPGSPPWTLLDYFPKDFLLFVDESHMTLPQIRGMYNGDQSRKQVLVDYGFRLPSALDNRPLRFQEFLERINQVIFASATPGPYEEANTAQMVDQVIRPTGLLDPKIEIRPTKGQVDDLLAEINRRVKRGERALVTTLTKRMAEDLSEYLAEMGIRVHYLHSEIDTIERVQILRDLRLGVYDVVVGINLLREGLDLPEVSLVAILDADKEGFLRSESALIQTMGRAARHVNGMAILYADRVTAAMQAAIDETNRRREIQEAFNQKYGITPRSIMKAVHDLTERVREEVVTESSPEYDAEGVAGTIDLAHIPPPRLLEMVDILEMQMKEAATALEFEKAAALRDQIIELRRAALADLPAWEREKSLADVMGREVI